VNSSATDHFHPPLRPRGRDLVRRGANEAFVADGKDQRIDVLDRQSLAIRTQLGDGGRQPGRLVAVHSIATDSRGNTYPTETHEGERVQRFAYEGIAGAARNQGMAWPRR
jgi:hypothetical protein